MKILNLYAGIGGNRKLWGDEHEVTAVEFNPDIARVYQEFYPNDTVIVGDAHEYLLNNYREFDFIWASPPCPTHSRLVTGNKNKFYKEGTTKYPDMKLYQEIILLSELAPNNIRWVIENVVPYYEYLIKPRVILQRHPFWSNFDIPFKEFEDIGALIEVEAHKEHFGVSLKEYKIDNKRQILRNMVNPEVGKYILDRAMNKEIQIQGSLF